MTADESVLLYCDVRRQRHNATLTDYCQQPLADYRPQLRQRIARLQLVVNRQLIVCVASFAARHSDCDTGQQQTLP